MNIRELEEISQDSLSTIEGGAGKNEGALWQGIGEGVLAGASIGSFIPGIGTLGGAVLLGTVGFIGGMFKGGADGGYF
ncbi:hypothetical protein [Streptococcus sobrinus]|uniref:hypothetical protein n=1 Tax=Streptococcus sobrinus TaxID=1310 RepID=UPI0002EDFDEC|nr:hypothetical protein [Streptococcus sobrinus]